MIDGMIGVPVHQASEFRAPAGDGASLSPTLAFPDARMRLLKERLDSACHIRHLKSRDRSDRFGQVSDTLAVRANIAFHPN